MTYSRQAKTVGNCEVKEIINQRGRNYTVLNARLLEPSPEYPTAMVSVRISNGADSTFTQLRIEEYDNLIRVLQGLRENIESYLPAVRQKEAVYIVAKEQHDRELAQIREIVGANNEEGGISADKIVAMMQAMKQQTPTTPNPPFASSEDLGG